MTLDGLEIHVWSKELVIVAPTLLGVIHRRVGILDQRLRIFTVVGVGAYSDAHGNAKTVFADAVRLLKLGDDLCGTNGCICCVCDFRKQYHKFIATLAAYRVRFADTGR